MSHYGSLLDPKATWLENLLLHEYMECYLYYSFYQDELDPNVKSIWEMHLNQEIAQLHKAAELLKRYDNKDWQQVVGSGEFPRLLQFHDTRDYVRQVLDQQILLQLTGKAIQGKRPAQGTRVFRLPEPHEPRRKQVASHAVIVQHQQLYQTDYRAESHPNPVSALTDRKVDNTGDENRKRLSDGLISRKKRFHRLIRLHTEQKSPKARG